MLQIMAQKLTAQITFRSTDELYNLLEKIAVKERRRSNEVARALLERGIAAYERDGELFEPEGSTDTVGKITAHAQNGIIHSKVMPSHEQREHEGRYPPPAPAQTTATKRKVK